jgi:hypothetical protein
MATGAGAAGSALAGPDGADVDSLDGELLGGADDALTSGAAGFGAGRAVGAGLAAGLVTGLVVGLTTGLATGSGGRGGVGAGFGCAVGGVGGAMGGSVTIVIGSGCAGVIGGSAGQISAPETANACKPSERSASRTNGSGAFCGPRTGSAGVRRTGLTGSADGARVAGNTKGTEEAVMRFVASIG